MYEEFLKKIPIFAELPDEDLARLCKMITTVHLKAGEVLFKEGSTGERVYVLKEGSLEVIKQSGNREVLLAVNDQPGMVIGEMALIEQTPRMASIRARYDSTLIGIHKDQLDILLDTSPSAAQAILHTVLARWRTTESMLRQSEKMAQLGTLTAGVAHELNNPAAAVQRSAEQLQSKLGRFEKIHIRLGQYNISDVQQSKLHELTRDAQLRSTQVITLNPLTRSDQESEIEEWLGEHGVDEGWELAPTLVNLGYGTADLEEIAAVFSGSLLKTIIQWLGAISTVYSLVVEIGQGAGRISDIVKALKSYSYLDQAPIQEVDIHQGLDNTLIILRSKTKEGIHVVRDYAADLPRITAYGSELNQVWTNLIDNAIDAMDGKGQLTIRTRRGDNEVIVEIEDEGSGIPEGIQPRIFDPFFTTKDPGKGTGLGLNITYNIIVEKHRGSINLDSKPGRTVFQIHLPIGS
ncbi:MAG: ATP-binding protein [Candidatus Promineifilaceae bacterium]